MTKKCIKCGSENLQSGKLQSTGNLAFYPEKTKFMTLKTSNINAMANMCMDCGFIEIIGDINKAKDIKSTQEL